MNNTAEYYYAVLLLPPNLERNINTVRTELQRKHSFFAAIPPCIPVLRLTQLPALSVLYSIARAECVRIATHKFFFHGRNLYVACTWNREGKEEHTTLLAPLRQWEHPEQSFPLITSRTAKQKNMCALFIAANVAEQTPHNISFPLYIHTAALRLALLTIFSFRHSWWEGLNWNITPVSRLAPEQLQRQQ